MIKINIKVTILLLLTFLFLGCRNNYTEKGSTEYIISVKDWHKKRIKALKTTSIWVKLAGLHWLEEGENTFGSSNDNKVVFPSNMPEFMGKIILENHGLKLIVNKNVNIKVNNSPVKEMVLLPDVSEKPTVMRYKNYWWYIIKRGEDRYGIRLIDDNHPNLQSFKGIPTFPVNEDWKVKGKWVEYNPVRTIETPSVIGIPIVDSLFGAIVFEVEGKEYKLHAAGKSKSLFIIFADGTSGEETYGAGRFVTAEVNYETKEVIIDFNKSINPPCSLSKYATCPLPPEENWLDLRITAGEKFEGHH